MCSTICGTNGAVGIGAKGKHFKEPALQAYVAGEVDPVKREAIKAHLDSCEVCLETLGKVEGVQRLLRRMAPPEPDELRWHRIREKVRTNLDTETSSAAHTLDLLLGRRWVTAGMAVACVVALLVWFAPRKPKTPASAIAEQSQNHEKAQTINTGESPLEVTLASGAQIRVAEKSRVTAPEPSAKSLTLQLNVGELDIRFPRALARATQEQTAKIQTPAFSALAFSQDFSVGYRADAYYVAVREGRVEVEGEGFGGKQTVREGERQVVRVGAKSEALQEPVSPELTEAEPTKKTKRASKRASRVSALLAAQREKARKPASSKTERPAIQAPKKSSSEGVTSVEVLSEPEDFVRSLWLRAKAAYYEQNKIEQAIEIAEQVVRLAGRRQEAFLAQELICQAHIAGKQPNRAVQACKKLLDLGNDEQALGIHRTLANLYRNQLDDCRSAMAHYNRALVFGRKNELDDKLLLSRATCALELGNLELVDADIRRLEARPSHVVRTTQIKTLKRRLLEQTTTQAKSNETERK